MRNRAVGFYFALIACILAVAGIITYTRVMYTTVPTYLAMVIAIALMVLTIILNNKVLNTWLPVFVAALLGFSVAYSFTAMINQIGYVIAGLDQLSSIMSFLVFVGIVAVGMVLAIIGSFLRQTKDE